MKILQPLSQFTTQELLRMMLGRSVLWYGAGFFTAMLLTFSIKSTIAINYFGLVGIIGLFALLVAESILTRKRIIPELEKRCQKNQ